MACHPIPGMAEETKTHEEFSEEEYEVFLQRQLTRTGEELTNEMETPVTHETPETHETSEPPTLVPNRIVPLVPRLIRPSARPPVRPPVQGKSFMGCGNLVLLLRWLLATARDGRTKIALSEENLDSLARVLRAPPSSFMLEDMRFALVMAKRIHGNGGGEMVYRQGVSPPTDRQVVFFALSLLSCLLPESMTFSEARTPEESLARVIQESELPLDRLSTLCNQGLEPEWDVSSLSRLFSRLGDNNESDRERDRSRRNDVPILRVFYGNPEELLSKLTERTIRFTEAIKSVRG